MPYWSGTAGYVYNSSLSPARLLQLFTEAFPSSGHGAIGGFRFGNARWKLSSTGSGSQATIVATCSRPATMAGATIAARVVPSEDGRSQLQLSIEEGQHGPLGINSSPALRAHFSDLEKRISREDARASWGKVSF